MSQVLALDMDFKFFKYLYFTFKCLNFILCSLSNLSAEK